MSALSYLIPLWAQLSQPKKIPDWNVWLYVFGEPSMTILGTWGNVLIWVKVVSLFCLLGWFGSWALTSIKERYLPRWFHMIGILSVLGLVVTVPLLNLQKSELAGVQSMLLTVLVVVNRFQAVLWILIAMWAEWSLWTSIVHKGNRYDFLTMIGIHAAIVVGMASGFLLQDYMKVLAASISPTARPMPAIVLGIRMSGTFMGFVVLIRVLGMLSVELAAVRGRRLYAIGWQTWIESFRRMWAPWVVLAIFLVILAFVHWFLKPPREAELGRVFVGTLMLLGSLLLTVMVVILTPISLPNDIQQQTVYTIVSKPVRRIEVIWGRMLGFMALVTALLLIFGGVSLAYLERTVGSAIAETRAEAEKARVRGNASRAKVLDAQADQMDTRRSARVPIKGSLIFLDSKGLTHRRGIDVGQDMESRSHIEGATQAAAVWRFALVQNPIYPNAPPLDRRIPVDALLQAGTIEEASNRLALLKDEERAIKAKQAARDLKAADVAQLTAQMTRVVEGEKQIDAEIKGLRDQERALEAEARTQDAEKHKSAAEALRTKAAALHSRDLPVEMTFNIYRTTKGIIGESVYASIRAYNPITNEPLHRYIFPIHEYYSNRVMLPSKILVGTKGALALEIQCLSATQYLGMGESDLYILAQGGDFHTNFMKGLFGIWLQAMVLTAIGVFAGSFLSWPVALLTTLAFFIGGEVAFASLQQFANNSLTQGGPFESIIRLLGHQNLSAELAPTPAVLTAKSLDALIMPVMSRLVYVVPNFTALDVSNTVADGFAVEGDVLWSNLLLALSYTLPFSIAGYFILKNREVAA